MSYNNAHIFLFLFELDFMEAYNGRILKKGQFGFYDSKDHKLTF